MIISISGGSGSGKSFLAAKLSDYIQSTYAKRCSIISLDSYYKNSNIDFFENYDHPDAFNLNLLLEDLQTFTLNNIVIQREYCYVSKESKLVDKIEDVDIVLLEGIYTFYFKEIEKRSKFKLYIDVDEETRVRRRLTRDLEERSISYEENHKMLNDFVLDMHNRYITTQKDIADLVAPTSELRDIEKHLKSLFS